MKKIILILAILVSVSNAFAQHEKHLPRSSSKKTERQADVYTCVMHPEIQMSKPGNCPKCGMALVKKKVKKSAPKATQEIKNDAPVHTEKTPPVSEKEATVGEKNDPPQNEQLAADSIEERGVEEKPVVFMQAGRTLVYHLYVTDTTVNYTGRSRHAYAINGSIPGPDLVFTEGDTAEIYLHNLLKSEETSLHWHGVILPNRFDGVPYLTTARIAPGETHLYKFAIVQNGTYWYHSHSQLQEQAGMYGALIFRKRETPRAAAAQSDIVAVSMPNNRSNPEKEYTVVLSEWTDEKPHEVQRRLRTANDWYAIKKQSVQSYGEAIKEKQFKTKFINEWKRMKAMDVSDVFYDRFLVNGKPERELSQLKAGDRVRLRVVNAGASSYFWLQYAGGKITVVANDGNEVEPVEVDRLIIAVAETYDLLVTVPQNMRYEFRATPEDRTKSTSLWLGSGMKMPAPVLPRLAYFEGMKMMNGMMKTNGDMNDMGMNMSLQQMDMNTVMYREITGANAEETDSTDNKEIQHKHEMKTGDNENAKEAATADHQMNTSGDMITLNYAMLRSPEKTTLPDGPVKELHFTLTGNMNRYLWTIDNKTVNEWDKILINKGEKVRVVMTNNSMMRHPMHLHGHDFRVLNGQGDYAPFKNVLDIMPMETDTIEFAANQDGNWFFHCHILYHMMAGMGNVFTYSNSPVNPELPNATKAYKSFKRDNRMTHLMAKIGLESNGSDGELMLTSNRFAIQQIWHVGLHEMHGLESETNVGRFFGKNQWLFGYVGFDYHHKSVAEGGMEKNLFGQVSNKNNRKAFVAGVQYTLPWLVVADARIDSDKKFRFQISREDIPVTSRLRLNFMANSDKEYMTGLRYIFTKWFSLSAHYDSDMGPGLGVTINY